MKLIAAALVVAGSLLATQANAATGAPPPPTPPPPVPTSFNQGFATVYGSRVDFNAAAPNASTDTFEIANSTSGGTGAVAFTSGSYTDPFGTTYSAPTNGSVVNLNVLDSSYLNGSNMIQQKFGSDVLTSNTEVLTINFAAPVNAFAIDFGSQARGFVNTSELFSFTVAGAGTQQAYSPSTGLGFFGFTSNTAFSSLTITGTVSGDSSYFDNASFAVAPAAVAAAPEPGTWALMLGGIGIFGAALRLRHARRREDDFKSVASA